jgi:hypothetical protein
MMMSSAAAPSFETAMCLIALNNIGISLLERNCVNQARETLQDAVEVMKGRSSLVVLDAAHRRLAAPKYCSKVNLRVLSDDLSSVGSGGCSSSTSSSILLDPHSTDLYAIRLDVHASQDIDIDLLSSIVLYNCGVAFLCVAKTHASMSSVAMKLFALSSDRYRAHQQHSVPHRSIFLAMCLLHSMIHALMLSGKSEEAQKHVPRLTYLRQLASQHQVVSSSAMPEAAAAA